MKLRRIAAMILICIFSIAACAQVYAAGDASGATTIKVAFYPLDGFFEYDENGNECGYGVDYLNELSKYANIKWEYVAADSWEGIKQMMLDGEVDVRMPVSTPTNPSGTYDYTVEPMLMSYHAIMTLKSNADFYYQDYDTIANMKIAAVDNLLDKTGVGDYLTSIGVLDNLVFFEDYNTCRNALDNGYVDAVISNVMDLTDDMKILDKFSVVDNYITTLKGNPCYSIINNALTQLKLEDPSFQTTLYEEYYPDRAIEPFTKEESEYIANTDHVTVAIYTDRKPVSYTDDSGNYCGIAIELANLISERAGIEFEYVPITTATQVEMLESADLVMPVPQNTVSSECFVTGSILDLEILMAVRNGSDELAEGARVGVLTSTPGIRNTMQNLGTFEVIDYANNREALAALQQGRIDAFANSSYVLNWMLENPRYNDLSTLRYQSFPLSYEICGRAENAVLQSVLNKAIRTITDDERNIIVQNGTKLSVGDLTVWDKLYIYRMPITLALLAFVLLTMFTLVYNRSRSRYIARIKESSRKQEEANHAKSDFLARMSHDMRTPLNVIMGMSGLARENANPPDTNDCLDKINISSEFLLGLINDVLDMEHIESGKMMLHPVPYSGAEFAEYIAAVIEPLCAQKNQHFEYTCEGEKNFVVMQDKLRINQVYFNLLSNAVKFTPEGGRITFTTRTEKTGHDTVSITVKVSDTGIGMKPEFMKHMFEPFVQENQELKAVSQGSGLGLAIVKRICDMMNMSISATSTPGCGTTFILQGEFPLVKNAPAPVKPAGSQGTAVDDSIFKDKMILVCEDHPLNQEIIRRLLEKKGCIVVLADNGRRGVEEFERSTPGNFAAILMDIRMPVMDGLQAAGAIRALNRPDAKTVPVIALTANAYEEDVKRCFDAGMNAHMAKPIDAAKMYETIKRYIQQ